MTDRQPLVLSLFPGIGLLDRAFEDEGFCIVRGPDVLWGGDVRRFHPPAGVFDGVIGGPPCPSFSRLRFMVQHNGAQTAPDLMPEFDRILAECEPDWFLCENVPAHHGPIADYYAVTDFLLDNRWVGGEQQRQRRFWFGQFGQARTDLRQFIDWAALNLTAPEPAVIASGGGRPNKKGIRDITSWPAVRDSLRLQGLPTDYLDAAPFTAAGAQKVVGNGVPLPMGRAIARAVKRAIEVTP